MEVAAGGGDAGVAESGLHQMNRRAAVKSMRSVRVPQDVFVMLMILVPQKSAIAIIRSMELRSNSFAIFGQILLRY